MNGIGSRELSWAKKKKENKKEARVLVKKNGVSLIVS